MAVSAPRRWREDDRAPPEVRDLLAAGRAPRGMSPAERARAARQAARLAAAPAGWFAWSAASKAVAASLATVGLVAAARVLAPRATAPRTVPPSAETPRTPRRHAPPSPAPAPSPAPLPRMEAPGVPAAPSGVSAAPPVIRVEEARTHAVPRARPAPPAVPPAGSAPVLAPAPGTAPAPAPTPRDESLAAEAALLARAQRLLEGDPEASLELLDAHAGFTHPRLAEERELLAVLALQRLGRGEAMRARGEAMLSRWPSGAAAQRVRRLLGATAPP